MPKHSVFISYGGPDGDFAERLRDVLLWNGIEVFVFSKDATPGTKLRRLMRDGVNRFGPVILVCSERSLNRPGVLNEIEETLQREAREGGSSILIPLCLDDHVFSDWAPDRPDIAQAVRDRVIADFRGVRLDDPAAPAVDRLLRAIGKRRKRTAPERAAPVSDSRPVADAIAKERIVVPEVTPSSARPEAENLMSEGPASYPTIEFGGKQVRLCDLVVTGEFDDEYRVLNPEERILLGLSSRQIGIAMPEASRSFALSPDRLRTALEKLRSHGLVYIDDTADTPSWHLSDVGRTFLKNNYWARLV